jgi:putative MATE family efflux protein
MKFSIFKQSTTKRCDIILNGKIVPTLLALSIPTLLMSLIQSAMPVVDGLFINNVVGTNAASAVTYSAPIIMMMTAVAQGLSVASMALIGQMNGKGEFSNAKYIAAQVVVVAFLLGSILAPFMFLLSFPISRNVNYEISNNVFLYLSLNSIILPFYFLEAVYNAIKNSSGKPEATFVRMLLILFFKIIFNFLFIVIIPLGIVGSVLATLFAHLIISVWMYYEMFLKVSDDKFELRGFKFDVEVIKELFRLGLPSILTSLLISFGFFLINNEVEKYGTVVLNGQGIANNITAICFILPASFGSSVTTMVSMNVGAGNGNKAFKSCVTGCIVSAISAIILIACIVPLSPYLTVLFTREPDVLKVANRALHIYTYSVVGFGICMVQLGAFIGLGRAVTPLIIGVLRIWLLRYIFILLTERFLGVDSVFWGNLFSNYVAAGITTFMFLRVSWISVLPKTSFIQKSL